MQNFRVKSFSKSKSFRNKSFFFLMNIILSSHACKIIHFFPIVHQLFVKVKIHVLVISHHPTSDFTFTHVGGHSNMHCIEYDELVLVIYTTNLHNAHFFLSSIIAAKEAQGGQNYVSHVPNVDKCKYMNTGKLLSTRIVSQITSARQLDNMLVPTIHWKR